MLFKQPARPANRQAAIWTRTRSAWTFSLLALIALVASNCKATTSPEANANIDASSTKNSRTGTIKHAPSGETTSAPHGTTASNSGSAAPPALSSLALLPENVMNAEVQSLDGKPFKLADYKGKVVIIDLWATWCGPCRMSIPDLIELSNEFKSRGVEVIGLTTEDPVESVETVRAFVKQYKMNYKVGWAEADLARTLAQGRGVIPQAFVITRDGRVLKRLIGYNPQSSPAVLREAVTQALNMPS